MAKLNQGSRSRNVREVGVKNSTGPRAMNVRAVSQIGQSLGNHVTETRKVTDPREVMKGRAMPSVFGNAKALDVGKGGCGTGRTLYGQSGTNCVTGPVNPGAPNPGAKKPIFPGFR
jgi:hypothetical protein